MHSLRDIQKTFLHIYSARLNALSKGQPMISHIKQFFAQTEKVFLPRLV